MNDFDFKTVLVVCHAKTCILPYETIFMLSYSQNGNKNFLEQTFLKVFQQYWISISVCLFLNSKSKVCYDANQKWNDLTSRTNQKTSRLNPNKDSGHLCLMSNCFNTKKKYSQCLVPVEILLLEIMVVVFFIQLVTLNFEYKKYSTTAFLDEEYSSSYGGNKSILLKNEGKQESNKNNTETITTHICEPAEINLENPNTYREIFRLSSFRNFPSDVQINASYYAAAGFYYTNFGGVVQCFACLTKQSNLSTFMDPFSLSMHKVDCKFARKLDSCGNVPLETPAQQQRKSEKASPQNRNQDAADLTPFQSASFTSITHPTLTSNTPSPRQHFAPAMSSSASSSHSAQHHHQPTPSTSTASYLPTPPPPVYDVPSGMQIAVICSSEHEALVTNLNLCQESERLRTYTNWPSMEAPPAVEMARVGFFYLGNLDRTQCFSCGGVLRNWKNNDNPWTEHSTHFPHCAMVQGRETRNIPSSCNPEVLQVPPFNLSQEEKRDLLAMFPCDNPETPNMVMLQRRVLTFGEWPYTKARPLQMAQAGFFALGVRDRVRCFFCGGGLQSFRRDDDPWVEHSKWYPTCEYLLQQKGPAFVHHVVSMFPDLVRPVLSKRGGDIPPPSQRKPIESSIELAMKLDSTKAVIEMGYEVETVRRVQQEKIDLTGRPHESASELLDATMDLDTSLDMQPEDPTIIQGQQESIMTTEPPTSSTSLNQEIAESSGGSQETLEDLKRKLEEIKDSLLCKVCLDRQADVVFIPCGHICCCLECTQALRQCPVCRVKIEKAVRTYTK